MYKSICIIAILSLCIVSCQTANEKPSPSKTAEEPKPVKVRRRGFAEAEIGRPKTFPHRIWAACDFEGRTPNYGWFGPTETTNIPKYPGNVTALAARPKPYKTYAARMTGVNPVPGPRMGTTNFLCIRYFLKGKPKAKFQHYSLTRGDNNNIIVKGLTLNKWSQVTMNFTRDARRNDGSKEAFAKGERMDDLKVYVGKPDDGVEYHLILDDIIFFSMEPDLPPEKEPFPNRVIFLAAFDTGDKETYWPGNFELVQSPVPDSYWRAAKSIALTGGGKEVRIDIKPDRPLGAHTKIRFRYHAANTETLKVKLFNATQKTFYTVPVKELKQKKWIFNYLDFTKNGKRDDGKKPALKPLDKVNKIEFIAEPVKEKTAELYIDEVVLFDAGK
jgi:hypothetical protein